MLSSIIRRLALAALDCGPSTLRQALEGDADARRVLVSQGITPHDLTAITDARAARRRNCKQPRPQPDAAHPPPPGADYPNFRCVPEPPRTVPVFGPWGGPDTVGFYDADLRISSVDIVLVADADQWWARRGGADVAGGPAPDIDAARRAADRWAREQGWVLLDAEPGYLQGSKITLERTRTGQLCRLEYDTTPSLHAAVHKYMGWAVQLNNNTPLARGPQTGAEGERLLRAALDALGVEVLDA